MEDEIENSTGLPAQEMKPPSVTSNTMHEPSKSTGLSLNTVFPVHVSVKNLSASVLISSGKQFLRSSKRIMTKEILQNISVEMPSGSLTAIMGASGSGKTSLLNLMSGRMGGKSLKVTGYTEYNGIPALTNTRSAYVMQQDLLLPNLTVRETLQYSADLRLPTSTSHASRRNVVEEIILQLGLKECANSRVGDNVDRGCSGGERRRVSIGAQMLSNPSVLFLDEPTTGLDATSAFQLVKMLKGLAQSGRTIIMTIHQPRSEIWSLLDNLVLLASGHLVYSGLANGCIPYFDEQGFGIPPFVNPAEYIIDMTAVDTRSSHLEERSKMRVEKLIDSWTGRSGEVHLKGKAITEHVSVVEKEISHPMDSPSIWHQILVLTARTFKVTLRDRMGVLVSILEAIFMGVISGLIFLSLDGSLAGIRSRQGALYNAASLQLYLFLIYETYRLSIDMPFFDRERTEGIVTVTSFIVSRRVARMFIEDIPVPLIFSVIFYFMAGFRAETNQFFTFFAVLLILQYIAVSFAILAVSISRNFDGASMFSNIGFLVQSMSCGYLVQANTMPVYMRWSKWASFIYYAFGALCSNEFAGHFYSCPVSKNSDNPACVQYTGTFILQSLGIQQRWKSTPIAACVGFAVLFQLWAGLVLKYWSGSIAISKSPRTSADRSLGKEQMAMTDKQSARLIDIQLDNYQLDIERQQPFGKQKTMQSILKPLTSTFKGGELNVIMGPSGCGKSSLLNVLAMRLYNKTFLTYKTSGRLLYNGAVPSRSVVRSLCSFVAQDDDALLYSLTVRETLRFSAGLRLPSWMPLEEKKRRADAVLLKLGLKDCADNLIGNDQIKGISGGEKRRVSIAVQILTDPRILLLDEPTSGLDAFTASSIMGVLKALADEGRTIISTIHQSRSDLFPMFGNILLLARGGTLIYSGKASSMLPHFRSLGYYCPKTTNPSDFTLDLITVDLQQQDKEDESRKVVHGLVEGWKKTAVSEDMIQLIEMPAELGCMRRDMAKFKAAFPVLLHRAVVCFRRQPPISNVSRVLQAPAVGIGLALYYAPLHNDFFSVQNRMGLLLGIGPLYFVGMLLNIARYPHERHVFTREHDDITYSLEAFFFQYLTMEVPLEIITSLIFSVFFVIVIGLPRTAEFFFIVSFNAFCLVNCGESLGLIFHTLFDHAGFAVLLTTILISTANRMGGIMSLHMPAFLKAFNWLSPIKYSIGNLAPYSLRGIAFTCTSYQRLPNGLCPIETGEQVLQLYNLDVRYAWAYLVGLGVTTVLYRALAFLLFKIQRCKRIFQRADGKFQLFQWSECPLECNKGC